MLTPSDERHELRAFWVKSILVVIILTLIAFVFAILWNREDALEFEAGKQFLQFLFIGFLGALVAFLVDTVKERRDQSGRERDFIEHEMRSLLMDIDDAFRAVKNERRQLRLSTGYYADHPLPRSEYLASMQRLNELELKFESFGLRSRAVEGYVRSTDHDDDPLSTELKRMNSYLGDLQTEVEKMAIRTVGQASIDLGSGDFSKLRGFVVSRHDPYSGSTFSELRDPYRRVSATLVDALAGGRLLRYDPPAGGGDVSRGTDDERGAQASADGPADWPPPRSGRAGAATGRSR